LNGGASGRCLARNPLLWWNLSEARNRGRTNQHADVNPLLHQVAFYYEAWRMSVDGAGMVLLGAKTSSRFLWSHGLPQRLDQQLLKSAFKRIAIPFRQLGAGFVGALAELEDRLPG
jgi:hypothetical protein